MPYFETMPYIVKFAIYVEWQELFKQYQLIEWEQHVKYGTPISRITRFRDCPLPLKDMGLFGWKGPSRSLNIPDDIYVEAELAIKKKQLGAKQKKGARAPLIVLEDNESKGKEK